MDSLIPELLSIPIRNLDMSKAFKRRCVLMGFLTIKEITATPPAELFNNKHFDCNWFGDLITLLSQNDLLHLLQPIQGNSGI
jgi:hypothetical protein